MALERTGSATAGDAVAAVVETRAIPRKCWIVDGFGKAIGLRNWRTMVSGVVCFEYVR